MAKKRVRLQQNTVRFGISIPKCLYSRLDAEVETTETNRGVIIARALETYFKSQERTPEAV
ncbi:MAG: hypothetical protein AAFY20_10570 [Cyanobacteria bacterium J06639_14]